MTLSICTAQLNFVVGDMPANAQKIIAAARQAHARGARLLLTPELAICGYAAEDLFLRPAFIAACDDAVKTVARETADLKDLAIVLGHPRGFAPDAAAFSACINAASVLRAGQIEQTYAKRELPNYQVFDEGRYFVDGHKPCVFDMGGRRVGLLICEDAWFARPPCWLRRRAIARWRAPSCWRSSMRRRSIWARAPSASRSCASGCSKPGCRWSMPTWSAARTRWCSKAARLRSMPMARWPGGRRGLRKNWCMRTSIHRRALSE